jgi:F-type H+-transporting ATPase subunit delta
VPDRIDVYADALLQIAKSEGNLTDVEDDLFRFARVFESNENLRLALTDPGIPAERRMAVVEELMGGTALSQSAALVSFVVGIGRASELPAIVGKFVEAAAQEREHEVAEVRSAVELTAEQQTRLAAALSQATGKQIEVKVVIDPRVLGGVVTTVGDTVIDGSVRSKLEQLRERI